MPQSQSKIDQCKKTANVTHEMVFPRVNKGLKIASHNVNRLKSNNCVKLDELRLILEQGKPPVDVYGVCETFLGKKDDDNSVNINGFQCIRKDRQYSQGGGLLFYVRNGIDFKRRHDLESNNVYIESLWLEITLPNKNLLLCLVYRPPGSNLNEWLHHTEDKLCSAYTENKQLILMGDINIDFLKDTPLREKWHDVYSNFELDQIIRKPTRITENTQTLIDHIYISADVHITHADVVECSLSDHFVVYACVNTKNNLHVPKHTHQTIKYRNFRKFEQEQFNQDLYNAPWSCYQTDSVNEALQMFMDTFTTIVDKHIPLVTKRAKRQKQPEWLTDEILESIKLRDSAMKKKEHRTYKYYRNKTTKLINNAKKTYYRDYVENNKNNPSKLSKMFNQLSGKNNKNPITLIKLDDDLTTTNEQDIANAFNEHFTNIAEKYLTPEMKNVNWETSEALINFVSSRVPTDNTFKIPPITEHYVSKFLSQLDSRKATGLDKISAKILKLANPFITHTITHICNLSITTNTFPDAWKLAQVTPIFKKNSTQDLNNYRPISILPVLSKLIEKHVSIHLYEFLNSHNLITSRQSGFRAKHSCETALHQMLNEWLDCINNKESVGILFIDFCKAFDLVDTNILLQKMKVYNFSKDALTWFTSYLQNRKQSVRINSTTSKELTVQTGVPQGSILGPLSFLLQINDLPLQPTLESTSIFADDATSSASGKTKQEVETKLQRKTKNLKDWCKNNKMVVSIEKTKLMLMDPKNQNNPEEPRLNVTIQGNTLQQVKSERLLGVQIDQSLTWDGQIKKQRQSILFKISLLKRIKTYLPLETRKLFYNYYIKPHFEYCNTIWTNCTKKNLDKMLKLQKQAARMILDEKLQRENTRPSSELFIELDWMTFNQTTHYRQAQLVFKSLNNLAPPYMRNLFNYVHEVIPRPLRSATDNKLYLPKAHPKSIKQTGPRIWNSLHKEVRNAKNLNQFKRLYLKHI